MADDAKRPAGEVFGTHLFKPEQEQDEYSSFKGLDPDYVWFAPGLLYTVVGLNQSIIQMYTEARQKTLRYRSYRMDTPVIWPAVAPRNGGGSPWLYTIQGLLQEDWDGFKSFVASYTFTKNGQPAWTLTWDRRNAVPPGRDKFTTVNIWVMLPSSPVTGRSFCIHDADLDFTSRVGIA